MKVLSKIDRFSKSPQLNFQGNPHASTFEGVILSICIIGLLLALFSVLMSSAVDNPTTASIISPMSFTDELDLVPSNFMFCTANPESGAYDANGNPASANAIALQQIFEQDIARRVQVFILSKDGDRVDRAFTYCPDKSVSPPAHCICLKDESVKILPSDTLYVKVSFMSIPSKDAFPWSYFIKTTTTSLIPNKLTDPFLKHEKTLPYPAGAGSPSNIFSLTVDRLIYKIDNNYFFSSPKTTYSAIPTNKVPTADDGLDIAIYGWSVSFSGQTITTQTTATKILSILAQVGALNGVFVIVFTILLLSFFKLKYTEKLLNGINEKSTGTASNTKGKKKSAKIADFSPEDIELQSGPSKKRAQALVRKKYMNKKPLYISFREWICPSSKRAAKVKALQENQTALREYFDVASVIRTNMEVELLKKVFFSPEQLYLLENIPFESFTSAQNGNTCNGQDTPELIDRSSLESFDLFKNQDFKEDMQSRYIDLMKKYYD